MARSIVWFRRDLRLADNAALAAAIRQGEVIPAFAIDPVLLNSERVIQMRDGQVAAVVDNRAEIEERVVKHAGDHQLAGLKVLPIQTAAAAI